jgi:hypothetical protein
MADTKSDEVQAWLRKLGFDVRVDQTTKFATGTFAGRPDMMLGLQGRAVYGENKFGRMGWNTKRWTPKQRAYAEQLESQNGSEVYLFLMVGKDEPHYDRVKYQPRTLFIIPFRVALHAVKQVEQYQTTLPFRPQRTRGRKKAVVDLGLTCEQLFSAYALRWLGDGQWGFPPGHPFFEHYLQPVSFQISHSYPLTPTEEIQDVRTA